MFRIEMHLEMFAGLFLAISVITTLSFLLQKKKNIKNLFFRYGLIFYILTFVKVAVLPITIVTDSDVKESFRLAVQLMPFHFLSYFSVRQTLGNIILFIPLPILLQGLREKGFNRKSVFLIIFGCSILTELLQYFINAATCYPSHVTDVDDIILNCLGGLILLPIWNKISPNINPLHQITDRKY